MKKLNKKIMGVSLLSLFVLSNVSPLYAEMKDDTSLVNQRYTGEPIPINPNEFQYNIKGNIIEIISTDNSNDEISIIAPNSIAKSQMEFSLNALPIENGISEIAEIYSSDAINEFNYDFLLQDGMRIDYLRHAYTNEIKDGSLVILNRDNEIIAYANAPKATDSSGQTVNTAFTLRGDSVVLDVNHNDANVYPVTAKFEFSMVPRASNFYNFFKYYEFINRDGALSISLMVNHSIYNPGSAVLDEVAWQETKKEVSWSSNWYNEAGLYDQFMCHAIGTNFEPKDPWNLEPWRPNVGWVATCAAKCNP